MHTARRKTEEFPLIKSKSFSFKVLVLVLPKWKYFFLFSGIDKVGFYCARVKKRKRRNFSWLGIFVQEKNLNAKIPLFTASEIF